MDKKIGRNEPCPCGSGKKFKKCCYDKIQKDLSLPEEMLTGTPIDECMMLIQPMMIHASSIIKFDKDGKELKDASDEFERKYKPGNTSDGVPDSMFVSWMLFDFRFGKQKLSVYDRFKNLPVFDKLHERGQYLLHMMSQTYSTFYEILSCSEKFICFKELYTGKEFSATCINEPFEKNAVAGDIWYTRLLNIDNNCYIYSSPYTFHYDAREFIVFMLDKQMELFEELNVAAKNLNAAEKFIQSCKGTINLWADYFTHEPEKISTQEKILTNTDHDLIQPTKLFFIIRELSSLKEKLTKTRNFDFDKKNEIWIWFKKGKKNTNLYPNVTLGTINIKDNNLIAETNSLERALKLRSRLENEFCEYLTYEKMESFNPDMIPKPSPEELEKILKEQEKLNANPEVQKMLLQQQQNYYLHDWINHRVPALNNKSPLQAVKSEQGRKEIEKLFEYFEKMQENNPIKVDFNLVRKKLGLSTK